MIMGTVISIVSGLVLLGILGLICLLGIFLFKKITGTGDVEIGQKESISARISALKDTLFFRIAFAGVLILISLIPLSFVEGLIYERGQLYNSVSERMTREWSGKQTISGPVISIPYEYTAFVTEKIENKKSGEVKYVERAVKRQNDLIILPETLSIVSDLQTQELSRGIYSVPIYDSTHVISGAFKWPDTSVLKDVPETIMWDKAIVTFMISSTKGVTGNTQLIWDGERVNLSAGTGIKIAQNGVHARLKLDESFKKDDVAFQMDLNLRGSRGLYFAPTGRNSSIALKADWQDPSFEGELLPTTRDIQEDRFAATWEVAHLSRSFGQLESYSAGASQPFYASVEKFSLGVNLFKTVDLYTLLTRTAKYGVLFIVLTFFTLFIIEFASGVRFHWLQHLIIGGALSMFYLCVLALSEHIAFGYAYLAGVLIIAFMVGLYAKVLIGKTIYGLGVAGVMLSIYAILYSILQMEDFALLIGTTLLLGFLGIGMFITRKLHKPDSAKL